jgi:hypothetical protein
LDSWTDLLQATSISNTSTGLQPFGSLVDMTPTLALAKWTGQKPPNFLFPSIIASSNIGKVKGDGAVAPDSEKAETNRTANLSYHDHVLSRGLQAALQRTTSRATKPERTADCKTLVDWFTTGIFHNFCQRNIC